MIGLIFVIIGAIATIGGAVYTEYQQREKDKEDLLLQQRRNDEYANIIARQDKTIDQAKEIIDLQGKLQVANEKIMELQNSTINTITGGDSKPILLIEAEKAILTTGKLNECYLLSFSIKNSGEKYPLKNVKLSMVDFVGSAMRKYLKIEKAGNGFKYEVGDFMPKHVTELKMNHDFTLGKVGVKQENYFYRTSFQNIAGANYGAPFTNYQISVNTENLDFDYIIYPKIEDGKLKIEKVDLKENGTPIDAVPYFEFKYLTKEVKL